MKYLKISCSYVLKSTSYLDLGLAISAVGLDLSSPAHSELSCSKHKFNNYSGLMKVAQGCLIIRWSLPGNTFRAKL